MIFTDYCLESSFFIKCGGGGNLKNIYIYSKHYYQCSQELRPSRIGWRPCPIPGPECISSFLTSAFILQTFAVSHKKVQLINCSDSDSEKVCLYLTPTPTHTTPHTHTHPPTHTYTLQMCEDVHDTLYCGYRQMLMCSAKPLIINGVPFIITPFLQTQF